MYTFIFDEVFYSFVSLCVVIHSVEFFDCCYITSYTQMINKNVLFPVDTEPFQVLLFFPGTGLVHLPTFYLNFDV